MKKNLYRKATTATILSVILLACFSAISKNTVSASGGSITMTNCYPSDGEKYEVIDHFTEQVLWVNTNTTVSVTLDGGVPIPMIYKGLISEVAEGDSIAQDWYTWEITIHPLTVPGLHSFQFFGKYFVWQETDQYWSEFNYSTNLRSFIIENPALPNASNNSNYFENKELSVSAPPAALAQKMLQPTINNAESKSGSLNLADSAFAFLFGTICAVAGAVLIVAIVVMQIFSKRSFQQYAN